jgi:hypothetical protein
VICISFYASLISTWVVSLCREETKSRVSYARIDVIDDYPRLLKRIRYVKLVILCLLAADGGEEGFAEEEKQRVEAEKAAWKAKIVVGDTTFRCSGKRAVKPSQVDRYKGILRDPPRKLAIKKCFPEPAPISMFLGAAGGGVGCGAAGRFVGAQDESDERDGMKDRAKFVHLISKDKRYLYKPGLDQSWYGSLRDEHLMG